MAINLESLHRGVRNDPPRILIYGPEKVGKTTFASQAPSPVFLKFEEGQGSLDLTSWDINSFSEATEALGVLANEKHDFQTVVIDSLDWMEPKVWGQLIQDQPTDEKGRVVSDIEGYGFGKGYKHALKYWETWIDGLNYLRTERKMVIIQIAHSIVKTVNPPDGDSYDEHTIKLADKAGSKMIEFSDCVFFVRHKVHTTDVKGKGFSKDRKIAVGSGESEVMTQKMPSYYAGNRYSMPTGIKLVDTWDVMAQHIPYLQKL